MDFKATIDLIINDIKELEQIVDDFKNFQGIPSIQVKIAESKCRNAIEILDIIKEEYQDQITAAKEKVENAVEEKSTVETVTKTTDNDDTKSVDVVTEKAPQSNTTQDNILNIFDDFDDFDVFDDFKEKEPAVQPEPKAVEVKHQKQEPAAVEVKKTAEVKETVTSKKPQESAIIAERFNQDMNRINEIMGSSEKPELSKGKKVTNLFGAIGISDKFLYIRELFRGDSSLYTYTITRINESHTFEDAYNVLKEQVTDVNNEAFESLLEMVKRKF